MKSQTKINPNQTALKEDQQHHILDTVKKVIPKVSKNTLLVIAGSVWIIAGFNIMRMGTPGMIANWTLPYLPLLGSAIVWCGFFLGIFMKMVRKHTARIVKYEDNRIMILNFFDKKAYIIMTFMITFGVLLRKSGLIPPLYLGIFYTGLGFSLICAGLDFYLSFIKVKHHNKADKINNIHKSVKEIL